MGYFYTGEKVSPTFTNSNLAKLAELSVDRDIVRGLDAATVELIKDIINEDLKDKVVEIDYYSNRGSTILDYCLFAGDVFSDDLALFILNKYQGVRVGTSNKYCWNIVVGDYRVTINFGYY